MYTYFFLHVVLPRCRVNLEGWEIGGVLNKVLHIRRGESISNSKANIEKIILYVCIDNVYL